MSSLAIGNFSLNYLIFEVMEKLNSEYTVLEKSNASNATSENTAMVKIQNDLVKYVLAFCQDSSRTVSPLIYLCSLAIGTTEVYSINT